MELTILTDNTTRIDAYYLGEPGVSYYITDGEKHILFDTGYSDVYCRNAAALGIDLSTVDAIVLSHGHNDHTRGLLFFPPTERKIPIYAHPDVFSPKRDGEEDIGMPMSTAEAEEHFDLHLSREPVQLTEHLTYLGQIPRTVPFENRHPVGERLVKGEWEPDFMPDDSALVYRGEDGLTVITGCSHAGICNTVEYAKKLCGDDRIVGIIGGFHMLAMTPRVAKTVEYLKALQPKRLCPCHCTNFHARAAIHAAVPVEEVCVGDCLKL